MPEQGAEALQGSKYFIESIQRRERKRRKLFIFPQASALVTLPSSLSVGSVAGHWLFSRRRWLNPSDDDDRRALEEGYHRLCVMLPAFKACQLSTFLQVLGRTAESWARRASECWANHKIVVFNPRSRQAQSITSDVSVSVGDCGCDFGDESAAEALIHSLHQHRDSPSDSDCDDDSDLLSNNSSTYMGGDCSRGNAAPRSPRFDWSAVPEDAVALQLLQYTRTRSAASAAADKQESEGTAEDMDLVLEMLAGRSATAEDMEEWARCRSF